MPTTIRKIVLISAISFAASMTLHAQQAPDVLTWHNDNGRTGANPAETILTVANVNAEKFGKVGFFSTDGVVDAEPLFVAGLTIQGAKHNVLYIATEGDNVYAKDADTGAWLWKTVLLKSGETTSDNRGCTQITPEIGVTSTPVIDRYKGHNGAIYVVSMSKDSAGKYHQRINALDLVTGAQLFNGPTEITASYPGTGANSTNGKVVFDPGQYAERAGLLLWNGAVYTAWTSHCDSGSYTGWIIGYDAETLKQKTVLNVTPNGNDGAIWMGGAGLAATPSKILFLDANGTFDTTLDGNGYPINHNFGNSFLELAASDTGQLQVADYYATDNTVQQTSADIDLGSGGTIALPLIYDKSGIGHQLAVGAGKDTNIYVVDRTNLGKYHPEGGSIYQALPAALPHGAWAAPAYAFGNIYYGGVKDTLTSFTFSDGKLLATPTGRSANTFGYPGTTPSISSNGNYNGIVWALSHTSPAVLYAYNAADLADELYDSNQSGTRDQFGATDRLITQTVVNGHVYVPTQTGVAVFGLLGN